MSIPFFVRDRDCIKILSLDPNVDEAPIGKAESQATVPKVKVATWSPDGMALAMVDPARGVAVIDLSDCEGNQNGVQMHLIAGSSKATQGLLWSPLGSSLVTTAAVAKGSTEPNLQVWRRSGSGGCESGGGTGEYLCAASFVHPKLQSDKQVVKWTADETFCARLCPDGTVHLHDGADLAAAPLAELAFQHPAQNFEFAPVRPRAPLKARLAVFVPDVRDDLQRVAAPAEVMVWEVVTVGVGLALQTQPRVTAEVASGQMADLKWSPSGTAVLAHCTTEVDESGKSYYGGSQLMLLSYDDGYQKDLTESDETTSSGTSVQAVDWSPSRDEFILIRGFQPAQVTLWSWDAKAQRATMLKVLLEKAHRNTIRFNLFGSLVCLAGFGNLAGEMDFFGRLEEERPDYVRVSSCIANCTVSAEWAPDGRHLLTAVLSPRMRVDNGLFVWRALSGTKVTEYPIEELYEVQWRPEAQNSLRFLDVAQEEVERATSGLATRTSTQGTEKKKQAYRPPKARGAEGSSTVAAMMRGEVAAPDADERRNRRPWQPRPREGEEVPASPSLAPSSDPPPPADRRQRQESGGPSPSLQDSPKPSESPSLDADTKDTAPVPTPAAAPRAPPAQRPPPPPEPVPSAPWAQTAPHNNAQSAPAAVGAFSSPAQSPLQAPAAPPTQLSSNPHTPAQAQQQHPSQVHGHHQPSLAVPPSSSLASPPPRRNTREGGQQPQQQPQQSQQTQQSQQSQPQQPQQVQHPHQPQQPQSQQPQQPPPQPPQPTFAPQRQPAQQQLSSHALQGHPDTAQQLSYAQHRQPAQPLQGHPEAMRGYPHHSPQQYQQPRQPAQQPQTQVQGENQWVCPATGWQYVDPKGNIQGPFTLLEMQLWNTMGYFRPDLLMRCDPGDHFVEFGQLFPPPSIPFESYPRRITSSNGGAVNLGGR